MALCDENHLWLVDSFHKGPVIISIRRDEYGPFYAAVALECID